MTKKICDNCKKTIKDEDGLITVNAYHISDVFFSGLHVCEKCIPQIPALIKKSTEEKTKLSKA